MEKISVLVLEGDYKLTSTVLFCLSKDKNLIIHFLSRIPNSPFRYSRYVKSHHFFSPDKPIESFFDFAKQVSGKTKANVLLPIDEEGFRFICENKKEFSQFIQPALLPEAHAFKIAADKGKLAEFMIQNNIPAPKTILRILPNLEERLRNFTFPVLLKPTLANGGKGIMLFHTQSSLMDYINGTIRRDSFAMDENIDDGSKSPLKINLFTNESEQSSITKGYNKFENYIIQSYIDGYDIDCNVAYKDGVLQAYSIQKVVIPNSLKYHPSEAIEFVKNEEAISLVDQLMKKLRWSGVAHIDLRYDNQEKKMKVIEINPRFWLTVIASLECAKVNFPALIARLSVNKGHEPMLDFSCGKYMPLFKLLKYNYLNQTKNKVNFSLNDTSIRYVVGDPLPKIYFILMDKFSKQKPQRVF